MQVGGAAGDTLSKGEAEMHLCLWESLATDPGYLCSCSTHCAREAWWLLFSATCFAMSKYKEWHNLCLKAFTRQKEDLS